MVLFDFQQSGKNVAMLQALCDLQHLRCKFHHHPLICHKYHIKHTFKPWQCNLDCLNKTCMVAYLDIAHPLCGYCHHKFICLTSCKHASQKCILDLLKSERKEDTNGTLTCAVSVHTSQMNNLW